MLLSIVIPVHNRPDLIQRCLDTVIPEIIPDMIEVIVVDDQSDTETKQLLQGYGNSIKIIETKRREGVPGPCRNLGVSVATGDYIWCVDYDDIILKGAGEIAVNLIQQNYNFDIIYLGQVSVTQMTEWGGFTKPEQKQFCEDWQIPESIEGKFVEGFVGNSVYWYCCPWMFFYKRSIFDKQKFHAYAAEDLEFFVKALGSGYSIVNGKSCLYRKIARPDSLFHNLSLEKAFKGVTVFLNTVADILLKCDLDEFTRHKLLYSLVAGPVIDFINTPNLGNPDAILEYINDHVDDIQISKSAKKVLISYFVGEAIRQNFLELKGV